MLNILFPLEGAFMNVFSKKLLSLIVFFLSFGVLKPFTYSYTEYVVEPFVAGAIGGCEKKLDDLLTQLKLFQLEKELEEFYEQRSYILMVPCLEENSKKENTEEEQDFVSQKEDNNSVSSVDQNPVSELEARELFGFSGDFTEKELKDRYKELLRQWHPDKNIDNEEQAKEMSQKIINANERLKEVCKSEK